MTDSQFKRLLFIGQGTKDYRGRELWTPNVIKNTQFNIAKDIDTIAGLLNGDYKTIIHCFWEGGGHVSASQHYKGVACDFHFEDRGEKTSYYDKINYFYSLLKDLDMVDVGLGLYPNSNSKYFHLDLRGRKARWGMLYLPNGETEMITYERAYEMAKREALR